MRGDCEEGVRLALKNVAELIPDALYEKLESATPSAIADRNHLAWGLAVLGRFAEGVEEHVEAARLAAPTKSAWVMGITAYHGSLAPYLKGEWRKALAHIDQTIEMFRAGDISLNLGTLLSRSAVILARLGAQDTALGRLREAEELGRTQDSRLSGGDPVTVGLAWFEVGYPDRASRCLEGVHERFPGFFTMEAGASRLLGDIAMHPDAFDAERAETHYFRALAVAGPCGMRPLVAHCHLGLGKLFRRTGKRTQSDEHLTTATTMYREMGMTYWLEQAELELGELA